MRALNAEVLATLRASTIEGTALTLPGQLSREHYVAVDRVLRDLGGRWDRRRRVHVFETDPRDAIAAALDEGRVATARDLGWFPTPPELAAQLVGRANVRPGDAVLEPSAGEGAIVEALLAVGARVTAIEFAPHRVERLRARFPQVEVLEGDFLAMRTSDLGVFGAVVMNPPFSVTGDRDADARHALHALECVRYDGAFVAVLSAGVTFRQNGPAPRLRARLDELRGTVEALPEGAFRASGTDVRAVVAHVATVGR